jgi:hypothetical protein
VDTQHAYGKTEHINEQQQQQQQQLDRFFRAIPYIKIKRKFQLMNNM